MEFTKERLLKIQSWSETYGPGSNVVLPAEEAEGLARIALASLEADPVAEVCEGFTLRYIGHGPAPKSGVRIGDRLYTAPPAPAAVPDEGREQFEEWFKFHYGEDGSFMKLHRANGGANYHDEYVDLAWIAWRDSRAAMLQGAEQTNYRGIVERIAEIVHGKVTDIDLLTVTVKSMKDKLHK